MTIDQFDTVFFNAVREICSEPEASIIQRVGKGPVSSIEMFKIAIRESEDFAQKLVYRVLAEILVDE